MRRVWHLVRRAIGSIDNRGPSPESCALVARILNPGQLVLWEAMAGRDRRHSLHVLRRFDRFAPDASGDERAAALLHDVGKTSAGLGWFLRVIATVIGPRGGRFTAYHEHEQTGAELIAGCSSARTVELVRGSATDVVAAALRRADDI
jgi:hypothetical protein